MLRNPELPMLQLREVDSKSTEQGLVRAIGARFVRILSEKGH